MVESQRRAQAAMAPSMMRAAVARPPAGGTGTLTLAVEDVPVPVPDLARDEALIKVTRAGVCNTDLELMKGYMGVFPEGRVFGHEFVGVVVQAPESRRADFLGKRVCADINVHCDPSDVGAEETAGPCAICHNAKLREDEGAERLDRMRRNHCPRRTVLGILNRPGCFSEYLVLPCRNLHLVPSGVGDEAACFAEPLAAALRVVEQDLLRARCWRPAGATVAVIGDGKLGLLIAAAITLAMRKDGQRGKVVLVGRHRSKLDLLAPLQRQAEGEGKEGVPLDLVDASSPEGAAALRALAKSCDVAVDATGNANGFETAMNLLIPRGVLVLKSTCAAGVDKGLNLSTIVIDELVVVGSRCGPIDMALRLLGDGQGGRLLGDLLRRMVQHTYKLEDAVEAFATAGGRGCLKVVIEM